MSDDVQAAPTPVPQHPLVAAGKMFLTAYKVELILFAVTFAVLTFFSGQRFLRQSAAPHFVYQAKAFLDGRVDIDGDAVMGMNPGWVPEDWACIRDVAGIPTRCAKPALPSDKWYSSFPAFPAVVMMPFVAIHGYQFNDTSFGVLIAALAVALFYSLLRVIAQEEGLETDAREHQALALLLAFGTVFFYCSLRGEVWFSAEVMGVAFTCLYARNALKARRPVLAGLFFSMAVLTRTPLLFTGLFFVLEAAAPTRGKRMDELKAVTKNYQPFLQKIGRFALGAAPLAVAGAIFNRVRFGAFTDFGHRFFYDNRVNADIDRAGLFNLEYLPRNLEAAFLKLPLISTNPLRIGYDAWGLSLLLTLPLLVLVFAPNHKPRAFAVALCTALGPLLVSYMFPADPGVPLGTRGTLVWVVLAFAVIAQVWLWQSDDSPARLKVPLALTVAACALPGLCYQNTGYSQFGFRFSLDYTVYLLLLFAVSGWSLKDKRVAALAAFGVVVNFWGAAAFSGYTELVRHW